MDFEEGIEERDGREAGDDVLEFREVSEVAGLRLRFITKSPVCNLNRARAYSMPLILQINQTCSETYFSSADAKVLLWSCRFPAATATIARRDLGLLCCRFAKHKPHAPRALHG